MPPSTTETVLVQTLIPPAEMLTTETWSGADRLDVNGELSVSLS